MGSVCSLHQARHAQRRRPIPEVHPSFLRKTCGLIRPPVSGFQNDPGTRTPRGGEARAPHSLRQLGLGGVRGGWNLVFVFYSHSCRQSLPAWLLDRDSEQPWTLPGPGVCEVEVVKPGGRSLIPAGSCSSTPAPEGIGRGPMSPQAPHAGLLL